MYRRTMRLGLTAITASHEHRAVSDNARTRGTGQSGTEPYESGTLEGLMNVRSKASVSSVSGGPKRGNFDELARRIEGRRAATRRSSPGHAQP